MAGVDWEGLSKATNSAVEDVVDALAPLGRELGVAASLHNPAVPMAAALELLPEIVRSMGVRVRRYPCLAAEEPVAVQASVLAGLIVLLADALLSVGA